ncbi:MAG: hypothetical protein H8E39_00455 [Alphaproteobacteria bacterium]|nr:hypothetical protein [Alphaproteobacteria bacterium]
MAEHIQIGDISPRIQYTGDGTQTIFTYPFPVFADADMEVYEDQTLKTLTTHYTVSGAGDSSGGSVTFVTAPANGATVTLKRQLAIQRTSDFQESGEFRSKVINDELDTLTASLQQVDDEVSRSLRLSTTDTANALTLPDKASRAGMYLGFDANGDPIATDAAGPQGPTGPAGNMDGANNLSELTNAATARGNMGLGTAAVEDVAAGGAGDLLRADGDGSALTGITGGATDAEKANILLNAFRIAVQGGLSVQNMVDGVVDEYEDETGVDTGTSTNEVYDATNDLYSDRDSGVEGSAKTVGASALSSTTHVDRDWAINNSVTVTHIGVLSDHGGSATINVKIMHEDSTTQFDVVYDEQFTHTGSGWEDFTLTTPFDIPASGTYRVGVWSDPSPECKGSTNADMETSKKTGNLAVGDDYTGFTASTARGHVARVTYLNTVQDMTLVSNATTALAEPTDAFIALWQEDVDAITPNTDLKAYASRDGGATWTQITLTQDATLGTGRILTGSADISAQPSGTSMKYKVETLNTKEQKIHGVALQWS